MSYLVDTNVISELKRREPDKNVLSWFQRVPDSALYLSVITLGEIRHGIEKLKGQQKRKEELRIWLDHELPLWFGNRILNIDQAVADKWGYLIAKSKKTMPAIDGLLTATAVVHDLRIVTRNTKDFKWPELELINPWDNQK